MASNVGIIIIGIWTLLQSILYGVLSGLSYAAHNCHISMFEPRAVHILYAWYFQNDACGEVNWSLIVNHLLMPEHKPEMPPITDVAFRMSIISYVYFATSVVWLFASVFLLIAECAYCCRRSMVVLWILATTIVVLVDFAASGIFVWDLTQSVSAEPFQNHFQMVWPASETLTIASPLLAMPSVVMILVSSRALVFWILNIVLIFVVWRLSRRSSDDYMDSPIVAYSAEHNNNMNYARPAKPTTITEHQMQEIVQEADTNIETYANKNHNNQHQSPLSRAQISRYDDQALHIIHHGTPESFHRKSPIVELQSPRNYVEHRYFEPLKNGSPSDGNSLSDNQRLSIVRPQLRSNRPTVPPKPQKSNRESSERSVSPMDQHRQSNLPPDELRGQLPWSYFKNPNDIHGPKRTFTQLRDDEDLPPVPVPDYTLHFPRKERPSTTNSSDDGEVWSGPEHRY